MAKTSEKDGRVAEEVRKVKSIQVHKNHYLNSNYVTFQRFTSYYLQLKAILKINKKHESILEVGKGAGVLSTLLQILEMKVDTFDIAKDLNPTYTADISEIKKIVTKRYDIICCFEILEHIAFEELPLIFDQICSRTNKYFILSVPQCRFYISTKINISKINPLFFYVSLPFPIKHNYDGQHYWELGKKGYGRKKFERLLCKKFKIIESFDNKENPYHRYYICVKKND